jgi:hypothetical protein
MTITFNNKDFKETLSLFSKLSSQSSNTHTPISFAFDPFRMVMVTDHSFVSATPNVAIDGGNTPYTFNPEILLGLTLSEGDVRLSWENDSGPISLKNNYLETNLKLALPAPTFDAFPSSIDSIDVPTGLMASIKRYLEIPFVFFNGKKELMPIRFYKNKKGFLTISADDGFSIARITTSILVNSQDFEIKIPKYIVDCLYSKCKTDDTSLLKIGFHGYKFLLTSGSFQIYSSSLNDDTSDLDQALNGFKPITSLGFSPTTLATATKPLINLLPKKDRSGSIISFKIQSKENKVSLSTSHIDVGVGSIEKIEGIRNIWIENEANYFAINMHPAAFYEYTSLLDIDEAILFADNRVVHYTGKINTGGVESTIEYAFPTVQV